MCPKYRYIFVQCLQATAYSRTRGIRTTDKESVLTKVGKSRVRYFEPRMSILSLLLHVLHKHMEKILPNDRVFLAR
jgi:hypothetical protein